MPISLHSHSGQFCNHAKGTLDEVANTVVAKGFRVFGLSEHIPRSRAQDLYEEEKHLTPADLAKTFDSYVTKAREVQAALKSKVRILVGAETEFIYPEQAQEIRQLRDKYQLDYLVGSLHHVNGIPIDITPAMYDQAIEASGGTEEALFSAYFAAQAQMLQELHPEVVGHMDVIRIFRPKATFSPKVWAQIDENIRYAISYGAIFEINPRAWKKGLAYPYPQKDVISRIQELGGKFTLGDDSHGPQDVGLYYDRLAPFLNEVGISHIYYPSPEGNRLRQEDSPLKVELLSDQIANESFWSDLNSSSSFS
ncbi:MAG: Polymerase/histidinol phosphatase-like protein [Piptocephalis tieghemiana]|nr:MAG: Polymerase/histidinol phosphatase-like protein [Piptocephalis tieghemiana]